MQKSLGLNCHEGGFSLNMDDLNEVMQHSVDIMIMHVLLHLVLLGIFFCDYSNFTWCLMLIYLVMSIFWVR
jgi:hypothetical protein